MVKNFKKFIVRKAIITFTNELLNEIDIRIDEYTEKKDNSYYNGKIDALNENYFMMLKLKDGFLK